jgi:hypothetical protein
MTCEGCAKPAGGIYIAGCRSCTLRWIARSPAHDASRRARKLTPRYVALLAPLGDAEKVHLEVKTMAAAPGWRA